MKKLFTVIAILCCAACLGALAACGGGSTSVPIEDVVATVVVGDGSTELVWQRTDGVSYDVYRAPSFYSEYERIATGVTDGRYEDADRFGVYRLVAKDGDGKTLRTFDVSEEAELFGPTALVFSPDDDGASIASAAADIYSRQYDSGHSEFTSRRYAMLFKAGEYASDVKLDIGYYTVAAGLGLSPNDVSIQSLKCKNGSNGNALINFWRGAENLTVRTSTTWAVSQGAFLRSVKIIGDLELSDGGGYASGGFLADSYISGTVGSGSQQQWLSRNCAWGGWRGGVWNMCFSGVKNAPKGEYPTYKYTVEQTNSLREKPFLVFDKQNGYRIAVPSLRENAVGCSWTDDNAATRIERFVAMEDIYFARADRDGAAEINAAFAAGKSVVLAPGVYALDAPIKLESGGAILLGLGLATLRPTRGDACLTVEGDGARVCGLLFDAGESKSDCLVSVGTDGGETREAYLHDCFFRVGGATDKQTAADCCLRIYADGTVCDNLWIWRADHGAGVGWGKNSCDNGIEVYGDDVTAYGLMSEHFKKHNAAWYGERGRVFFYQSEIAYDVPAQSVWTDGDRKGYASFKVDGGVTQFEAQGLGIYCNFHNAGVTLDSGMIVPGVSGVTVRHICTVKLNNDGGYGGIANVVNGYGGGVGIAAGDPAQRFVTEYKA